MRQTGHMDGIIHHAGLWGLFTLRREHTMSFEQSTGLEVGRNKGCVTERMKLWDTENELFGFISDCFRMSSKSCDLIGCASTALRVSRDQSWNCLNFEWQGGKYRATGRPPPLNPIGLHRPRPRWMLIMCSSVMWTGIIWLTSSIGIKTNVGDWFYLDEEIMYQYHHCLITLV